MGPPNVLGPPKPTSSISTITTLGAPCGRLDLEPRRRLGVPRVELLVGRRLLVRASGSTVRSGFTTGSRGRRRGLLRRRHEALQPVSVSAADGAENTSGSASQNHTPSRPLLPRDTVTELRSPVLTTSAIGPDASTHCSFTLGMGKGRGDGQRLPLCLEARAPVSQK